MTQKSKYKYWDQRETSRLSASINRNTTLNGRIQWRSVKRDFPDRTPQQIKSYYSNVIRLHPDRYLGHVPRMSVPQQA